MIRLSVFVLMTIFGMINVAQADDIMWPALAPGEIKVINEIGFVPNKLRIGAGLAAEQPSNVEFTFFKAPKGRDYVVVTPCCGVSGTHAALFEFVGGNVQPVGLAVGDPRLGFTAQVLPDEITVDPDAKSIRAHVGTPTCEDGEWRYFYSFDASDRLYLRSAIDTSCEHLGIRELYHASQVDVGKWWNR